VKGAPGGLLGVMGGIIPRLKHPATTPPGANLRSREPTVDPTSHADPAPGAFPYPHIDPAGEDQARSRPDPKLHGFTLTSGWGGGAAGPCFKSKNGIEL
jgi:hypothetical protein